MKGNPEQRALEIGAYIAQSGATVRQCARLFGVSKSTVHKDLRTRLRPQNPALYRAVQKVLDTNKAERHLRGGAATRAKYKRKKRP